MKEINTISIYFLRMYDSAHTLFTTPLGISLTIPIVSSVATSSKSFAIYSLGLLMLFDFITGIGASYVEKKELEKTNPELKNENLISSKKLKLSLLKIIIYFGGILCAHGLETTFYFKPFEFSMLEKPVSISLLAIGFCCAIEFYSIFFENFKRMGIDILGILKKMVGTGKEIKETIS